MYNMMGTGSGSGTNQSEMWRIGYNHPFHLSAGRSGESQLERRRMECDHALKLMASTLSQPNQQLMANVFSHPCQDSLNAYLGSIRSSANRVLATTAKGRTRWSRAMLRHRSPAMLARLRILRKYSRRRAVALKKAESIEGKLQELRLLVPGCEKVTIPTLLDEAIDYVAAVQNQIRALAFLSKAMRNMNDEMKRRRCGPSPPFPTAFFPTKP